MKPCCWWLPPTTMWVWQRGVSTITPTAPYLCVPTSVSADEINLMADAAEDHRASSKHAPRTIYGRIVAESDRQIIPETVILRCMQYTRSHFPDLDEEGEWNRMVEHLQNKYAEGGYLQLWIPESDNAQRLAYLRTIIADKLRLRQIFLRLLPTQIQQK